MKVNKKELIINIFKYIIILFYLFSYISALHISNIETNFTEIKNMIDTKNLIEEPNQAKPLTFLKDETNILRDYIMATLEDDETMGEPNCIYFLGEIFRKYPLVTLKLIEDSSHTLSKLGSYQDCKFKVYYNDTDNNTTDFLNYVYVLFYTPATPPNPRPTLFSICVPEVIYCKDNDYANILTSFNSKTEIFDSTQIVDTEVFILNDDSKKVNKYFYIGIIVLCFFAFILLCEFFPSIPICLFKCCFKKKIISENISKSKKKRKNKNIEIYETASLSNLGKSFDLKDSIGEIYGVESNSGINNDSGISFLKGLRGISLMLFVLGKTLESVYQYPVKKTERLYFNCSSLSFLYFFNRFTKNLFLSLSSFSLCYKIICYLDNEIELNELKNINIKIDDINPDIINNTIKEDNLEDSNEIKKRKSKKSKGRKNSGKSLSVSKSSENISSINAKKENNSNISLSSSSSSLSKSGKKSFSSGDLTKMPSISQMNTFLTTDTKIYHKISFKSFFIFLFRQFYKYILFVAIVLIVRYSYYDFVSIFGDNPMWEFIKSSYINKLDSKHMLSMIFLYLPFSEKINKDILYDPYDIVILEISLFIIFSLILFIIYKSNIRFDIILFILFLAGIAIKISAYYIILRQKTSVFVEYFYPSMGFTNNKWRFLLNNIFYYIPSISIGLFFGLVNYAIQKSAENINDFKAKIYLSVPIKFVNLLKKSPICYSFIFSLIFILLFIWCGLSYDILFLSEKELADDSLAAGFYKKNSINVYYSCDVDILVFSIFLAVIPFNLIGENIFISFLKHEYWNILSKPYYSYMLIIQVTGTNILYRMNTSVELDWKCVVFFSIINFIFGIILGAILYTFFEIPLKKLNKFILGKKEDNKNEEENEEEQQSDNIQILNEDERATDTIL